MSIKIIGTGSYLPEKILTNFDLEKIVETSDEWIRTRTGIEQRRVATDAQATSDLAYEAAKKALEMANTAPEELDGIIVASITVDHVFPSTACILQQKLNAMNAFCFDLEAACSGLIYSLEVAHAMIKSGIKYRKILVIGAEKLTSVVNWQDRNTCVLFGDGAAAMVLEKSPEGAEDFFLASNLGANGNYANILQIPAGGSRMPATHDTVDNKLHCLTMSGQDVFKLAVNAMVSSCNEALNFANIPSSAVTWLVPHQANYRILKAVASRLDIPEERVFMNVNRYGNTSAASIGICIDEMVRGNYVKPGDLVLLTAFGGGLTWGSILIRW